MTGARAFGIALAALAAVGLGAASRLPWTASPEDLALLRLSWRAPSLVAEHCHPLTEAEKAELPVHMRVPEVCETHAIPFVLESRIDGVAAPADTIHGAGARADRPVIVFREIPVAVGTHTVEIGFRPLVVPRETGRDEEDDGDDEEDDEDDEDRDEEDDEEEDHDDEAAIPLAYSETLRLGPREVALIILDPERRALVRVEQQVP